MVSEALGMPSKVFKGASSGVCRRVGGRRSLPGRCPAQLAVRDTGQSAHQLVDRAASRMRSVTASGCEIMATCDDLTSTVVAWARWAMKRSVAGGMVLSRLATMYQDGIVFQAGGPDSSLRMER